MGCNNWIATVITVQSQYDFSQLTFALGGCSAGAEQQQVDEVFAVPDQQLLVLLNPAERAVEELTVLHVGLQVLFLFVPGGLNQPQPHQAL